MGLGLPKDLTDIRRFFAEPSHPRQRQYEALRAFFLEDRPSHEVARAFGYTPGSFRVQCHQFRRDPEPQFFSAPLHGLLTAAGTRLYSAGRPRFRHTDAHVARAPSGALRIQ
jgi:hypothetical protein